MTTSRSISADVLTGALSQSDFPSGISLPGGGGKFASDGSLLNWPGNTFICHVDRKSSAFDAICSLQEEVKMSSFSRFFFFLPAPSFHMTVFQGVSPEPMNDSQVPKQCLHGEPRDAYTDAMLSHVGNLTFAPERRVSVANVYCCHSLTVKGLFQSDDTPLRQMRTSLRSATGIEPEDFDDYVFHITLAYLAHWLTEQTAQKVLEFSAQLTEKYRHDLQDVPLGPVEFCNFETMHHFDSIKKLV